MNSEPTGGWTSSAGHAEAGREGVARAQRARDQLDRFGELLLERLRRLVRSRLDLDEGIDRQDQHQHEADGEPSHPPADRESRRRCRPSVQQENPAGVIFSPDSTSSCSSGAPGRAALQAALETEDLARQSGDPRCCDRDVGVLTLNVFSRPVSWSLSCASGRTTNAQYGAEDDRPA